MEHLMSKKERRERKAEIDAMPVIPWLGFDHDETPHSLTTLEEYPISRGWTNNDLEELKLGKLNGRSSSDVMALIQSWLSFALLESTFGERFKTEVIVSTNTRGKRLINTSSTQLDRRVPREEQSRQLSSFKRLRPAAATTAAESDGTVVGVCCIVESSACRNGEGQNFDNDNLSAV